VCRLKINLITLSQELILGYLDAVSEKAFVFVSDPPAGCSKHYQ